MSAEENKKYENFYNCDEINQNSNNESKKNTNNSSEEVKYKKSTENKNDNNICFYSKYIKNKIASNVENNLTKKPLFGMNPKQEVVEYMQYFDENEKTDLFCQGIWDAYPDSEEININGIQVNNRLFQKNNNSNNELYSGEESHTSSYVNGNQNNLSSLNSTGNFYENNKSMNAINIVNNVKSDVNNNDESQSIGNGNYLIFPFNDP